MSDLVRLEQHDQIAHIILNRPEKRNAINWEMMQSLAAAVDAVNKLPDVRVIFIRGEGKAFSAGIDLMTLGNMSEHFGAGWRDNLLPMTDAMQAVLTKVERSPIPSIAMLHGYAIGLGFELALACDFRIVEEGTRIGLPETRLGIIPDVGGTTRLTRLVGPARAKELIMTGRNINLDNAERWGIVNTVTPAEQLEAKATALAEEICLSAPLAVGYAKRVIDGIYDIDRGLQLEAWAQARLFTTEDAEIGAQAAFTKQPPQWKGK